ncbi:hypothetical protein JB92DRAFT_2896283 [Gautieria morchelliformis]|nr:hypothetical protein JB92DRAFT_2896283 [Gautieria morchelliformis]
MAQALPSFVELLASLDIESDSEDNSEVQHYALYPTSPSFVSSSPSSSLPSWPSSQTSPGRFLANPEPATSFNITRSPSIIISSPVDDSTTSRRTSISNRYNPYVPPNAFTRRRSLPGDLASHLASDHVQRQDPSRAFSSSPPTRRASLGNAGHEFSSHLSTARITMSKSDQPISAFVRRRHPYSSRPQSPEYRNAICRSVSPTGVLMPVSLPSLPPLPRISTGTKSPAPPFFDLPGVLSISPLDRSSTATTEHDDAQSGATSETSTPPPSSRMFHDNGNHKILDHPTSD